MKKRLCKLLPLLLVLGAALLVSAGAVDHKHPICGAQCDGDCGSEHTDVIWTELTTIGSTLSEGSYYLSNDVTARGTSTIPVDIINAITGEATTMQLTLAHDGAFGFTLTLTAPLGKEYADLWANLYHYDAGALKFQTAARIAADGTVSLPFTHASEYAIIIDDRDHTPKAFPFTDVAESDWFYDAVDFVYQNELMNGTSATTFAPDGTMTRAMLVTILHRQAGEPVVGYALSFDDVAEGTWYTEAVRWAAAEGIVTGTSATTFAPDAPVTREQFAAILYRYAQQSGADVSVGEDTNILSYADALEISEYAIPAMQWACGAGVIEGSGANLNPQSSATRAEAAAMLMRFCGKSSAA